jgi:hypothetical protein
MSVSDMPKARKSRMTPRSARRVIKKYVRGNFNKRVQRIVDRNLKNTPTGVARKVDSICRIIETSAGVRRWFVWTPGVEVFKRNTGVGGSTSYVFEGQSCKIKKWWIKGTIQYQADLLTAVTLTQTEVGFVDLYLVRTRFGTSPPSEQLSNWYQSGDVTFAPQGFRQEMVWPINNNTYHIYGHRRFKMGAAWVRQDGIPAASVNEQNNDFSLARTFSFDVTRYVGKNKIVRYLDAEQQPSDNLLNTLSLVAIFHPACGDINNVTPGLAGLVYRSAFNIDASSWGEIETA